MTRIRLWACICITSFSAAFVHTPLLFQPGPPMLARDGRALAIVLLVVGHGIPTVACLYGARALVSRLSAVAMAIGTALLFLLVPSVTYWLLHILCYSAQVCGFWPAPERAMYALSAVPAGGDVRAFLLLALLMLAAVVASGGPPPCVGSGDDARSA